MSRYSYEILRDLDDLQQVREFWSKHNLTIESDYERYLLEAHSIESIISPNVIAVRNEGVLCTLIIGRQRHEPPPWKFGYSAIIKQPCRYIEVPRGGILGDLPSDATETILTALNQSLIKSRSGFVRFKQLDTTHPAYATIANCESQLRRDPIEETDIHWHTQFSSKISDYYASRSKKDKQHLKNYRNRLERAFPGETSLECIQHPDQIDRGIEIADKIAGLSYHRNISAGFNGSESQINMWRTAAAQGWFRMYLLHIADKPVAFNTAYIYKNIWYGEFMSFDPEYRKYNPGNYIMIKLVEQLFETSEVSSIDYGFGPATYKKQFGNLAGTDANLHYFSLSASGQLLRLARMTIVGSHRVSKRLLERFRVLDRVKTGWRRKTPNAAKG